MLCINPYAQSYRSMAEVEEQYKAEALEQCRRLGRPESEADVPEIRLCFNTKKTYEKSYSVPVVSEVAAIFVMHGGGEIPDAHIVIHPRGARNVRTLSTLNPDLDPMCFPLLLPNGTRGWGPNIPYVRQTAKRGCVSRREFIASRLAVRPGRFNPLHFGGKLTQEFVVCQYVYVEGDRMQWCVLLPFSHSGLGKQL